MWIWPELDILDLLDSRNLPMAKLTIQETFDAPGVSVGWVVISLPDEFKQGDGLPPPRPSDRYFATQDEAWAELKRRMNDPSSDD